MYNFNYFKAKDHLVYQFYTWVGIHIMVFNCINLILVEIIVVGKQLALEQTVLYVQNNLKLNCSLLFNSNYTYK